MRPGTDVLTEERAHPVRELISHRRRRADPRHAAVVDDVVVDGAVVVDDVVVDGLVVDEVAVVLVVRRVVVDVALLPSLLHPTSTADATRIAMSILRMAGLSSDRRCVTRD